MMTIGRLNSTMFLPPRHFGLGMRVDTARTAQSQPVFSNATARRAVNFGSAEALTFGQPGANGRYNAVISFHADDREKAVDLAEKLHGQGLSIILSEASEGPNPLLGEGNHTIALFSVNYRGTIQGNKALEQAVTKSYIEGKGRLLPVKIEECAPYPLLADVRAAQLYGEEGHVANELAAIVKALKHFEGFDRLA